MGRPRTRLYCRPFRGPAVERARQAVATARRWVGRGSARRVQPRRADHETYALDCRSRRAGGLHDGAAGITRAAAGGPPVEVSWTGTGRHRRRASLPSRSTDLSPAGASYGAGRICTSASVRNGTLRQPAGVSWTNATIGTRPSHDVSTRVTTSSSPVRNPNDHALFDLGCGPGGPGEARPTCPAGHAVT
jgi:hypothetical protein